MGALSTNNYFPFFLAVGCLLATIFFAWIVLRRRRDSDQPSTRPKASEAVVPTAPAKPDEMAVDEAVEKPPKTAVTAPDLRQALRNTKSSFWGRIGQVFAGKPALAASELEVVEEILYTSDLGPQSVQRLLEAVSDRAKQQGHVGLEAVRGALRQEMLTILDDVPNGQARGLQSLNVWGDGPAVVLIVGVNGAGKTTTIGKLAKQLADLHGKRVLVAAGDTFRAAAGAQLKVWTERAQVEIFSPEGVSDPSAVAFDACQMAKAKGFDVVLVDTAGRLHTHKNLMEELKKMRRVVAKVLPQAPHEVLLVLDANSGQNALVQAREFNEALQVTGVVLTKLDGTAKGGVAVGLAAELHLPIKLIGLGEGVDDLQGFSPSEFVDSIL